MSQRESGLLNLLLLRRERRWCELSSHRMNQSNDFRQSTHPPNRQLLFELAVVDNEQMILQGF